MKSEGVIVTDFGQGLKAALMAKPKRNARDEKILAIINAPPSKRRDKRLARMEAHVRAHEGMGAGAIDWSKIDWTKMLENIMALLKVLLPLLLAL